jgi:hypothetical protein
MIRDCLIPALKSELAGRKIAFDALPQPIPISLPPNKLGQIRRVL